MENFADAKPPRWCQQQLDRFNAELEKKIAEKRMIDCISHTIEYSPRQKRVVCELIDYGYLSEIWRLCAERIEDMSYGCAETTTDTDTLKYNR